MLFFFVSTNKMELLTKSHILDLEEQTGIRRNDLRRRFNQQLLDSQQLLKGGIVKHKEWNGPQYLVMINLPATGKEEEFVENSETGDYPESYYGRWNKITKVFQDAGILAKSDNENVRKEFVSNYCNFGFFEDSTTRCEDEPVEPYENETAGEWLDRLYNAVDDLDTTPKKIVEHAKALQKLPQFKTEWKEKNLKEKMGKLLQTLKKVKEQSDKQTLKTVSVQCTRNYMSRFEITLKAKNAVGKIIHLRNFMGKNFMHTGNYKVDRGGDSSKWKQYGNGYLFNMLHDFIEEYKMDITIKYKRTGEAYPSVTVTLMPNEDNENPDAECKVNVIKGPYSG